MITFLIENLKPNKP